MRHITTQIAGFCSALVLCGCMHAKHTIPSFASPVDVGAYLESHLETSDREISFTLLYHPEKGYGLLNLQVATDEEAAKFSTSALILSPYFYGRIAPDKKVSVILAHSHPRQVLSDAVLEMGHADVTGEIVRARMPPSGLDLRSACLIQAQETESVSYTHVVYDNEGMWTYDATSATDPEDCQEIKAMIAEMTAIKSQEEADQFLENNSGNLDVPRWIVGVGKAQLRVAYAPDDDSFSVAVDAYKKHISQYGFTVSYETYK